MIKVGKEPYLECSSKGDKRFSAMYARIKSMGNKTIEEIYQASKVFKNGKTGLSVKEAKSRKAINMEEVSKLYDSLWELYLKENPELIEVLLKYNGYSDIFGKEGHQCQAKSIYEIISAIKAERGEIMARTTTKGDVITGKKPVSRQIEKGVSTMEQTQNSFNVFNYTYYMLCRAYLDNGSQNEFTVKLRRLYDTEFNGIKYEGSQKVLGYLNKLGGLKVESIKPIEEFDEMGNRKTSYEIKIKDFDVRVKAKSNRTGNEYNVLQNALGRAMMAV